MFFPKSKMRYFEVIIFEVLYNSWFWYICRTTSSSISNSKLPVSATAHQKEVTFECYESRMASATHNLAYFVVKDYFLWCVQAWLIVMAKLAVSAVAPSVAIAFFVKVCCVLFTTSEIWDFALT